MTSPRATPAVLALLAVLALAATPALATAAGPFGVGVPEAGGGGGAGIFAWIAQQQSQFYRALNGAVRALKSDGTAVLGLVGLSFLYGVFHAAGPGHGKAVITSYVVANNETLRRGVALSFLSAFLQAVVATLLIGAATFLLNLTSLAITEATRALELASGLMIAALGLWLVWTKALRRGAVFAAAAAPAMAGGPSVHVHGPGCGHEPLSPARRGGRLGSTTATPGPAAIVCADCGHLHAPDPRDLAGPFSWSKALSAVFAVGIRPCSGALIVLVFAFSQGLFWAGALAAFAMAVGTGLTVAVLASLAVSAKSFAVGLAGVESPWASRIVRGFEIAGASAVLALGILILGAALAGAGSSG